ncbi:MAG: hypothetical protein M3416_05405 [Acidobacteriota bacterium]|nr:hypothetical protein [Acidobacteriota bacterium]
MLGEIRALRVELDEAKRGIGQARVEQERVSGLLDTFAPPPVAGTNDPLLDQLSTQSGTVTSVNVDGGATGFAFSGGPVTQSGTIMMSVSNAATARSALGIDDIATKKSNLAASAAPANEDSGDGYAVGSVWIDTTADDAYVCLDASVGAAVWKKTTP